MGVMNKMRTNTKFVLYVLVGAFGGLWVLQDSGAFDALGVTTSREIATVNGVSIPYEQFQNAVEQRINVYQQQGVEVTPAVRSRIEDEVFNALVDNRLREAEMDRLGVSISEREVQDAFTGPNPDPIILQLFGDGSGGVDRARLNAFIADPESFGADKQYLILLEEEIAQSRRQAKLDALIEATARVSEGEVEAEYIRRNRRASADYVAMRYADVPDDQVEVSDADLRSYYNDHQEEFERSRTFTVEYVTLEKVPTPEDSANVIAELTRMKVDFEGADDPASFVAGSAYGTGEPAFVLAADMAPALAEAVYSNPVAGQTIGPLIAGDEGVLAMITNVRPAESISVRARHILFALTDAEIAERVKERIQEGGIAFAAAAAQYSTDQSNSAQGGDLGWFGAGRMVRPFEDAVFAAPIGTVVGPVETQFGHHLILVEQKATQEAELLELTLPVHGSFDRLIEAAEDLRYYAESEGSDFGEEAIRRGLEVETANVTDDQDAIPGLQVSRDAFRWIRRSAVGDISDPLDATTAFVVFHVTEMTPEGFRPFDEVREEIEPRVLLEKKEAVQLTRLQEAVQRSGSDLSALAAAVGQSVQTLESLALNAPVIPGLGREPRVVGTAFGLAAGSVSRAIAGDAAAFVVRPRAFTGGELSALTTEERDQIREQLLNRKRQQIRQQWIQNLRDNADIEDFRDRLL